MDEAMQYTYNFSAITLWFTMSAIKKRSTQSYSLTCKVLDLTHNRVISSSYNKQVNLGVEKILTKTKTTVGRQYTQSHDINTDRPSFLLLQATSNCPHTYITVVSYKQTGKSSNQTTEAEQKQHIFSYMKSDEPSRQINVPAT
jgi:hypothetical protein